jgi:prepilin-type processing-associated H-X9-DG protein
MVRLANITDGLSKTIFMSESIRSTGPDITLTVGQVPSFPYQYTLNGSTGLTPGTGPGITVTGAPWTGQPETNGMIANPDLSAVWPQFTGWRGASGTTTQTTLRGRGTAWVSEGMECTLTNGYTTPNNVIPDLVMHHSGYFGPRSWHPGGANVLLGDGSTQFLIDDVDATTQRYLHSINGCETVTYQF